MKPALDTFENKTLWLVGASTGIGASLAQELSGRGARLILSARSEEKLSTLNQSLGGQHQVIPVDVADHKAVAQAASLIAEQYERLDGVIFMAAIYEPGRVNRMDIEHAHRVVDINLNGALNVVHASLPILRQQKSGLLALCGSVAGYRGLPNGQPYSATKAAVISLAESLRTEESKTGIDVKVINPGFVRTPMTDKNEFKMPMIMESDAAAKALADGLLSSHFEVHFPKRFTRLVKLVRLLPAGLYFRFFALK